MRLSPRAICALLLSLFAAPAQSAEEPSVAERVTTSIDKLAARRYRERAEGAQTLEAIGEPALKALKEATRSSDVEVRNRAAEIVTRIESRLTSQALYQAPKIRLKFSNVPLQKAVAEVAKKTGLPLVLDEKLIRSIGMSVTLDTGDVPFWQAMEQFMEATGLTENPNPEPSKQTPNQRGIYYSGPVFNGMQPPQINPPDGKIHLMAGKTIAVNSDKVVRVKAVSKEFSSYIHGSNELLVMLDVIAAPNTGWQSLTRLDVKYALDDKGRVLKQSDLGEAEADLMQANDWAWGINARFIDFDDGMGGGQQAVNPYHVPVKLRAKDSSAKYLRELRGVVSAKILSAPEALITVDDLRKLPKDKSFSCEGYHLTITSVNENKNGIQSVQVKVHSQSNPQALGFPGGFPGRARRAQPFMPVMGGFDPSDPKVELLDSNGKPITGVSQQVIGQGFSPNGLEMEYILTFRSSAKGSPVAKLALKGRRPIDVEIPFDLKNVPLP